MSCLPRLLAAAALGLPALAHAGPADYVRVPAVEYGEREIDFKYGTEKMKDSEGGERTSQGALGFGYGATPWWFTEAYIKYEKEGAGKTRYDAWEWENKFQLTEINKYPVDVGFFTEIEVPRDRGEGYELAFGPLVQFDTGPLRWNTNVFFEKVYRGREGEEHPTGIGYQVQAAYRLPNGMDAGVQAFGEMGKWNDWAPEHEQLHRIGPALFGKVKLGGREQVRYNVAYLAGLTDATPKNTIRLQMEFEF